MYDLQALLRRYLPAQAPIAEQVRLTRALLALLPASNSFVRELDRWRREIAADGFGDAGLYDLLLHSQDRSFDVPGLYGLARSAELDILAFIDRAAAYEPSNLLPAGPAGAAERERLAGFGLPERQAIAELMSCDLSAHEFYLGRSTVNRPATLADEGHALVLMGGMHGKHRDIADGLTPGRTLTLSGRSGALTIVGTPVIRELFRHMDAVTPLAEIYARVAAAVPGVSPDSVRQQLASLYDPLHAHGHLYLLAQGSYGVRVPDYGRLQPFT